MNINLHFSLSGLRSFLLVASVSSLLFSCQSTENKGTVSENVFPNESPTAADTTNKRPAPEFFIIPPELAQNRVWICDDAASDTFHTRHDCTELAKCKQNNGTYRNITLARAIETYGRYNCDVCSSELNHIFDENLVR